MFLQEHLDNMEVAWVPYVASEFIDRQTDTFSKGESVTAFERDWPSVSIWLLVKSQALNVWKRPDS